MIETIFFQKTLLDWYQAHGRHDLPWQNQSPYHVWLSEIMLQQTQVATVLPYYHRFILLFPSIEQLAAAPIDEILKMWAGLGYYHRARNLHKTAQIIVGDYAGQFPPILNELKKLPGIGAS
ncbi:MAG TPA: A/G-specific adenine glycosylase, partial [Legionellales bacterium]|nr:A/G-specific adenine glycosylase [Legionellales bacterium]